MQQMINEPTATAGALSSPSSCTRRKTATHFARDHEMSVDTDTNHQASLHYTSSSSIKGPGVSNNSSNLPDMQTVLKQYHSLAITNYTQTKRRKVIVSQQAAQNTKRVEQITTLKRMATDTLNFCTKVLKSEEHYRRENERDMKQLDEDMQRAYKERALAEDFLNKVGMGVGGSNSLHNSDHESIENGEKEQDYLIGGIPSRFLDLQHFPNLQKGLMNKKHQAMKGCKRPIIDCTPEEPPSFRHRIPSFEHGREFGIPMEVALTNNGKKMKQNTKRVFISHASVNHVNGTYIQEGQYNGASLFVKVGAPRKFWGKYDCNIVLRREKENVWKIGLVPAHRVSHPRIISYYVAEEDISSSNKLHLIDQMEEDNFEESSYYITAPSCGWRVSNDMDSSTKGRASDLVLSYE